MTLQIHTDNYDIDRAYRLATATVEMNTVMFCDGVLPRRVPCLIAGLGYWTPWTRDTAINVWNGVGLIKPQVALNTLKSVVYNRDGKLIIGGEYWDAIIWAVGAWNFYLFNGDREFLEFAYTAIENTLEFFEKTEFDENKNLFRGPACYGDGIAAYPDVYARHAQSGIVFFKESHKDKCAKTGEGLPMFSLSTNCLYYYAYLIADKMAKLLGKNYSFKAKAERMKNAINIYFGVDNGVGYRYLLDDFGGCDYQEGMGISFAVLFGIADKNKAEQIMNRHQTTPHGIPCVYPGFDRYSTPDGYGFGRHSGTVWPHIQGFWASAAASCNRTDLFDIELKKQTDNALRYMQFAEIYHPLDGSMYGGRQEKGGQGITEWRSEPHQTWSATAFLRNIYFDLFGMHFKEDGIEFSPAGSSLVNEYSLEGLNYRNADIDLFIKGRGNKIKSFRINGRECEPFLQSDYNGYAKIEITL